MPGPSARGRDTRDGRFASHDLLRAYAAELADEDEDEAGRDEARQRLADHYLHTAAAAAGQSYPARPALSLRPAQPGTVPEQLTGYADAQRWPCGGEPWRFWKSCTTLAPRRYGPGWALSRGLRRPASADLVRLRVILYVSAIMKAGRRGTTP